MRKIIDFKAYDTETAVKVYGYSEPHFNDDITVMKTAYLKKNGEVFLAIQHFNHRTFENVGEMTLEAIEDQRAFKLFLQMEMVGEKYEEFFGVMEE